MSEITTIGLDLAKHVFQVHGIDAQGRTVLRKRLRRGQVLAFFSRIPRCVVALEACATAHYWAREPGQTRATQQGRLAGSAVRCRRQNWSREETTMNRAIVGATLAGALAFVTSICWTQSWAQVYGAARGSIRAGGNVQAKAPRHRGCA